MLVLTRKAAAGDRSAIVVGPDVEVIVLEINGDQVRLGIQAPGDVAVHRREVWMQIQQDSEAASWMASTAGLI